MTFSASARVVTLATLVVLVVGPSAFGSRSGTTARCKVVSKVVHGRTRRVRVCKKPALPQAASVSAAFSLPADVHINALAVSTGRVWALTTDRRLLEVDATTGQVIGALTLPASEWPEMNVAVGNGSVWVTVPSPDTKNQPELDSLLRIDPSTLRATRIHVGHSPIGIAVTAASVWTANHRSEYGADGNPTGAFDVSRIDTGSDSETARVEVEQRPLSDGSHGPSGMTAAAGSVWISEPGANGSGFVIRIDPATNRVLATISFANANTTACGDVVGDDSAVWVASGCEGRGIARIDPRTNTIAAKITLPLGANVESVALGDGSMWTTTADLGGGGAGALYRISPATNKPVGRTPLPGPSQSNGRPGPIPLATFAGAVWVASDNKLIRLTPR